MLNAVATLRWPCTIHKSHGVPQLTLMKPNRGGFNIAAEYGELLWHFGLRLDNFETSLVA
jgi:hypothetical protein